MFPWRGSEVWGEETGRVGSAWGTDREGLLTEETRVDREGKTDRVDQRGEGE